MSNNKSSKRILVLGGAGFVGSAIVRALEKTPNEAHYTFRTLPKDDRLAGTSKGHQIDLSSASVLHELLPAVQPEIIINAAAPPHTVLTTSTCFDPSHFWTLSMLPIVLDYVSSKKSRKLIHCCSSTIYGDHGNKPLSETLPFQPKSNRGHMKLAERNICKYAARTFHSKVILARIFRAYGPYDSPHKLLAKVFNCAIKGEAINIVPQDYERDYIYIDDIADAIIKMISVELSPGEELNLGTGIGTNVKGIIKTVEEILGKKIQLSKVPYPTSSMDKMCWRAENTKAKNLLKWEPMTNLPEGLRKTIQWYQQEGHEQ